jgi:hypothetical protein
VLDPDRDADLVGGDARALLLGVAELLVRRRGRVDDEWDDSFTPLMNLLPASKPPLMPNVKTLPNPFSRYFRARWW